jgi:hypothetical protein
MNIQDRTWKKQFANITRIRRYGIAMTAVRIFAASAFRVQPQITHKKNPGAYCARDFSYLRVAHTPQNHFGNVQVIFLGTHYTRI